MKSYFDILGLPTSATPEEIKKAYRRLAKEYHPDRNPSPDAAARFIQINEAYEFLSDDNRRKYHSQRQTMSREEELRRERVYREWVRQQASARARAKAHAQANYEDFANSPIYRTAKAISKFYNYLFLTLGLIMISTPVFWYLRDKEQLIEHEKTVGALIMPGIVGLCFTYGIWYFLFKKGE